MGYVVKMNNLKEFFDDLKGVPITAVSFIRGYGIIEHYFKLIFENESTKYEFEIETNFRIRNNEKILLVFNDLYIDQMGKELSVRRYRSQQNIEKTLLFKELNFVNEMVKGSLVSDINVFSYGDIIISLDSDVWIEITNDTHLEDATLYRIVKTINDSSEKCEVLVKKNELVLF
jgi:beta-galactosidase/beta-glucuronidase